MRRPLAVACTFGLLLCPPRGGLSGQAPSPGVSLPPFTQTRLPSGATLLLSEKHDLPLIALTGWLRGGAVADPLGKEGVAALTAELLKKGSGGRNAVQFAEAVAGIGAELDAVPSREAVVVTAKFLARDQDFMIELLADMLQRPTLLPEEFDKVQRRSVQSIAAAKDSDPRSLIGTYYHAFLFGAHPYGRPVGGSEDSLAGITREDVLRYFNDQLGADRLILAAVGDFPTEAMTAKLRRAFGDWRGAKVQAPKTSAMKPVRGRRVLLVDKPDATQTYFWIGNVGIARTDPDRVGVDLANSIFGGRFTSLLMTELRVKSGLTYGAASTLSRESQPGAVAIASYTQTKTTEQAVDMALDVLERYRERGASPAALASAQSYVRGQFPPALETVGQLASRLAEITFYGLDRGEVDQYLTRVSAATTEDVKRLITRVYPSVDDLTFVFIGNAAAIRDVVRKYGPLTEMKITDKRFAPSSQVVRGGGASGSRASAR